MDSVTQIALGSAVGMAVMGRHTPLWKSALVGALCGTLPDLDVVIDYGDPISDVTYHRGFSHAFFYLTLVAPLLAWLAARVLDRPRRYRRWLFAVWLALVTHPLLDAFTVYGTQLWRPFSDYPVGLGSIFIIDPLYTLPLLLGIVITLKRHSLVWNSVGLALSSGYLAWSFAAQLHVQSVVDESLRDQGWIVEQRLVTPTAFNTLLWRVLVITPDEYLEGFYALADRGRPVEFRAYPRGMDLYERLEDDWGVARMAWFTKGYFKMQQRDREILITDLRMGQEPYYTFNFVVAEKGPEGVEPVPYRQEWGRPPVRAGLQWIGRRLQGEPSEPPWIQTGSEP
ncbi:metal-dependent hydrolase [Marinimicrobium sp. ABcell2]|uniref:metal-dependent hydrolase n=1 Tax=Marinimicrobium sp. ABcell2 TaxID=3069751 RepID=UPI0027B723B9|nr:metal-dependent hydrolase [Marinimicrobium sp. ABcell2]MDQ2077001.1 metal-dependent hydrolase [Marinimicrobium sp. ABcell2]